MTIKFSIHEGRQICDGHRQSGQPAAMLPKSSEERRASVLRQETKCSSRRYGNSRVMVYDADTGSSNACGARTATSRSIWTSVRQSNHPSRTNCPHGMRDMVDVSQFHCRTTSSFERWLAYVADRGTSGPVFTPEGRFVAEQFIGVDSKFPCRRGLCLSPIQPSDSVRLRSPDIYILNRRTPRFLLIQYRFAARDPPGHLINVDHEGNVYAVRQS